jgi:hypothetical protein
MTNDRETPFYTDLIVKKANGELPILQSITYEMMRRLWWTETICDSELADLFNIDKGEFTKYRYKLKVKQDAMSAIDLIEKVKLMVEGHGVILDYRLE